MAQASSSSDEPALIIDKKKCTVCNKQFCDTKGVKRHMKNVHKADEVATAGDVDNSSLVTGKMKCTHCDSRFERIAGLKAHMQKSHQLEIDIRELKFSNLDEFLAWKQIEEEATKSYYVLHNGIVNTPTTKYRYYYCNRSGFYKGKGTGKRYIKAQQSSKIDGTCLSHMVVDECTNTAAITVKYVPTHTGHSMQVCHLPISAGLKAQIASQLMEGVSVSQIMDKIRDQSLMKKVSRQHLLERRDVNNIKHSLNLKNVHKHSCDHTSTSMWVSDLRSREDYDSIVAYKPQGELVEEVDDMSKESFLLCIQTEFQRDMMVRYGNDVICLDSTHSTNMCDFLLITIMVIDHFGEGIPVAWAISDKEDACTLTQFFKPLHERVTNVQPRYFMSDDAQAFYNAWCGVFGSVPQKLLCMWHVDKSWRKAIQEKIRDQTDRLEAYHILRVLLTETDEETFRNLLQKALSHFEASFEAFYNYLLTNYANRVEEWASCYRINTSVNTNMIVESFHRVLKIVYFEHKKNRRIDDLLFQLFKINRDVMFNSLRKEEVGKVTHRIKQINKRHFSAVEILSKNNDHEEVLVKYCREEKKWQVKSGRHDFYYDVIKVEENDNCPLRCNTCNVCIHMYTCSCLDSALHQTICKHIHILHLVNSSPTSNEMDISLSHTIIECNDNPSIATQEPVIESSESFVSRYFKDQCANASTEPTLKALTLKRIDKLQQLISSSNESELREVNSHLISSIKILESSQFTSNSTPFAVTKRPAPNTNNVTQKRFCSTKKKRDITTLSLKKPTLENQKSIVENLMEVEPTVCGVCHKVDDRQVSNSTNVNWVVCTTCELWVHKACSKSDSIETDIFECCNCSL